MKISELHKATGGLGSPSKMPGYAYGLSARDCKLGSLLAKISGSTCSGCYALKGNYMFPASKNAHANRLESISRPDWVENMVELIGKKYRNKILADRVFRWHDSGDLQSVEHFSKIVEIAKKLPDIAFWLPTRERTILADYGKKLPANLIVRLSATRIGDRAKHSLPGVLSSTVNYAEGFQCPASTQGNECKDCRACWNPRIKSVNYKKH